MEQTGKDGLAGENSLTSSSYQTSKGSTEGLFGEFWPFWEKNISWLTCCNDLKFSHMISDSTTNLRKKTFVYISAMKFGKSI